MKWHVEALMHGQVTGDQMQRIAAAVSSAHFGKDGWAELRYTVAAATIEDALAAVPLTLQAIEAIRGLSGPHRLAVYDDRGWARDLPLVGLAEAADQLGLTVERLRQLQAQDPDFPAPRLRLRGSGGIFDAAELAAYNQQRERGKAGRPRKNTT